jgi:uncharacterized protein (DUF433 family)/DNA-binding transcriptional MerR regulator
MVADTKLHHVGVGLYSLPEAARLVGAPTNTVRRWASEKEGLVPRRLDPSENTLTFAELIELHFIKMFRDEGVSLQTIRRTSLRAAEKFKTAYPFSVKQFDTDGRTIFATLRDEAKDENFVEDLERGQLVFEKIMRPFFHKLEYRKTDLVRFWPLTKKRGIVIDPSRKFGKPIDYETGVPTRTIANAVKAGGGQSPAIVARWLGVSLKAVKAAVEFERALSS